MKIVHSFSYSSEMHLCCIGTLTFKRLFSTIIIPFRLHIMKLRMTKKNFFNYAFSLQAYHTHTHTRVCACTHIRTHVHGGGCPCGVMVKAMDCEILVSKFKLQLCYYVHFQTNTLGKGMNPLIFLAID